MNKEDKKSQYYMPFGGFKMQAKDNSKDHSKKQGNLSNMKSTLQANQSTDKNKGKCSSIAIKVKDAMGMERFDSGNIQSKLKKLIGASRAMGDSKIHDKVANLD